MSIRDYVNIWTSQASLETHEDVDSTNPAVASEEEEVDFDGFVPEQDVIFYGDLTTGEWEKTLMESHRQFTIWNAVSAQAQIPVVRWTTAPSLETLQTEVHEELTALAAIKDSMKVFLLPSEQSGFASKEAMVQQVLSDPEQSVVVMSSTDEDPESRLRIHQAGVVIVASMEDAALYLATAC